MIGLWGLGQLVAGATVYRWATWNAGLRMTALATTGLVSWWLMDSTPVRMALVRAFAWFGFGISVLAVLAYFTSPGEVVWLFSRPYPDVWGPFLSRTYLLPIPGTGISGSLVPGSGGQE